LRENVEPVPAVKARSLLAKDRWRAALADEWKPRWPKVARIVAPSPRPATRHGWQGQLPVQTGVVWPTGQSKSVGPAANPSEEVTLGESPDIGGGNKFD
jgi:hypothetical protein